MNSAKQVDAMVAGWINEGKSKAEIVVNTARAEIGWCYVWGATGQSCTPGKRTTYMNRQIQKGMEKEAEQTKRKCQVMNGKKNSCEGCRYYPGNERTLIDDCQGFVKQVCRRVGISFTGGGCTSMWNAKANWSEQGTIDKMPEKVCCVFWTDKNDRKKKSHIAFYVGNGRIVECSGEVKEGPLPAECTDYAIPKGLEGDIPVPTPTKPMLRRGSKGPYVVELQQDLMKLNYEVGPSGADGKYGAKTEAAVKAFQNNHGLKQDGICGPATWDAIEEALKPETETYTVIIHGLDLAQANTIKAYFPNAEINKEGD